MCQAIGDRAREAAAWHQLASIDLDQGDYAAAREKFDRALQMSQAIGDRAGEAVAWHQLATIDLRQGDYAAAREKFDRALQMSQAIGDRAGEAVAWHQLATIDLRQGDYAAAREKFDRALQMCQAIGDRAGEAVAWHQLATIDLRQGDYAAAREKFDRALQMRQAIGDRAGEAVAFFQLGALALQFGRSHEAARLIAICCLIKNAIAHGDTKNNLQSLTSLCSRLGYDQDQFDRMMTEAGESFQDDRGRALIERAMAPQEGWTITGPPRRGWLARRIDTMRQALGRGKREGPVSS